MLTRSQGAGLLPARMDSEPYISLVVAARNDNHGGNMLSRMQGMLHSWIAQATAYGLSSEIVIVEWNPPGNRPRLKDALSWPEGECQVRFIEVRPDVHGWLPNSASIPLHQMIAKNAGIRRARGEFILATNLDIIFSAELMRFLAERSLEKHRMYRMDRHDVASDTPPYSTVRELLEFCESHTRRLFAQDGEFQLSNQGLRQLDSQDIVLPDAGIRFGRGWSQIECSDGARYRWIGDEAELLIDPSKTVGRCLVLDAETGPSAGETPVSIEIQDDAGN